MWGDGPHQQLHPAAALVQQRILEAYAWVFQHASSRLFPAAQTIVGVVSPRRWAGGHEATEFWPDGLAEPRFIGSFAGVVALLIARNLPPSELAAFQPRARGLPACLNASCRAGTEWTRSNGTRSGEREWYCAFCGSRFLGGRIIGSFDFDHGDPLLSVRSVHRARADLVRWRYALYGAARAARAAAGDASVGVEGVFREAKVPTAGYLRAVRLQLVAIVRSVLFSGPLPSGPFDRYAALDARWRPPAGWGRAGSRT